MQCNFQVGQKVVCVMPVDDLMRDEIYTITGIGIDDGTLFVGVDRTYFTGLSFYAFRFRPVVERGTEKGMSILRELLNKTDKPVEELA